MGVGEGETEDSRIDTKDPSRQGSSTETETRSMNRAEWRRAVDRATDVDLRADALARRGLYPEAADAYAVAADAYEEAGESSAARVARMNQRRMMVGIWAERNLDLEGRIEEIAPVRAAPWQETRTFRVVRSIAGLPDYIVVMNRRGRIRVTGMQQRRS